MICFPNAKINLGLNIIDKREDGFHSIETIMMPIPLRDVLEYKESSDFSIKVYNSSTSSYEGAVLKTNDADSLTPNIL